MKKDKKMQTRLFLCLFMVLSLSHFTIPFSVIAAEITTSDNNYFLSNYIQTLYAEGSEIPVNSVKSALQTKDGYLWIAGHQGLVRYNGIESRHFTSTDGLPSFAINVLYEDSRNRLWVGTNNCGVGFYANNVFTFYSIDDGLPSSAVRDIGEDANGNIYVATTSGIVSISPSGTIAVHPELDNVYVVDIEHIAGGHFAGLLNSGEIFLFNENGISRRFSSDHFGPLQPQSLFFSNEGTLYVGTAGNLVYAVNASLLRHRTITAEGLNGITGFMKDSSGKIWVTANNGIGYFQKDDFTHIGGLVMDEMIECILEDHEGNFWVGSSYFGLLQLTKDKFTNINLLANLPNQIVNTNAVWEGDLYIGTNTGLTVLRNYATIENDLTGMLANTCIMSIFVDSRNRMWISTVDSYGVLLVKNDGSIRAISKNDGLASMQVRFVTEGASGDIYVGMNGGMNIIRNEEIINTFTNINGLTNNLVLSIVEGANGTVYVGSDGGGIYAISNGKVIANYTEAQGLTSGIILRMASDNKGVWISTGNTICHMDDTGIHVINGLCSYGEKIFDIKIMRDNIWLLGQRCITVTNTKKLLAPSKPATMPVIRNAALTTSITPNSWNSLADDGTLYISTITGVYSINTFDIADNQIVPIAKVSEVFADSVPVLEKDGVFTIGSDVKRVDIDLSLLSFVPSKDGTISFMLEGFDTEMTTANRKDVKRISYTNLDGGTYKFHLSGMNAGGTQSQPVTVVLVKEFRILELPIVQTVLIMLGIFILVCLVKIGVSEWIKFTAVKRQKQKTIAREVMSIAAALADSRDGFEHSNRVAVYSRIVGKEMGMNETDTETLYYAALLHDIGKTAIPDNILHKKRNMNADEHEFYKSHTQIGGKLLGKISIMGNISDGAKYHHERIDGKGYEGLRGDEIPLMARIICVCNSFDNMLMSGKREVSMEKAQSELVLGAGTKYDENVTAVLISLINEGEVPYEHKKTA